MCLCQAYKRCEIIEVKWISSRDNLIDAIIKLCQALKVLINTNKLDLKVNK